MAEPVPDGPRKIWTLRAEAFTATDGTGRRYTRTVADGPGVGQFEKVDVVPRSVVEAVFGRSASPMACLMQEISWFLRDYAETLDDSPHPRLDGIRLDVEAALREAGMHE